MAQKVLSRLVKLATNPGDLVFDPFMGVGSSGVAALQLDRRFTGIEIDPVYFRAAEKRVEAATFAPELFMPNQRMQRISQILKIQRTSLIRITPLKNLHYSHQIEPQ